ncbi:MAG TPA: carboxylate--amine ligase [Pseudonocardiaceae bacterium]|nr:carboxylate--amine ligase [Pseudonocardiaceae bacterium]
MDIRLDRQSDTPALVLKLDRNVLHHGGLGIIRSLGRLGVPVYGVQESPWAPAANSRYLRGRWLWRPELENTGRLRDGLAEIGRRIGRPAVLIPTDDAGAIFLAEHGADLRRWFLFPDQPPGLPRRLADKSTLYQLCRDLDVPCPDSAAPASAAEAARFAGRVGFPLVAKLATPWRRVPGLPSTSIVTDRAGLDRAWRACGERNTLLLQEFVPAGPDGDWFFHGYCDAESVCRPAFTGVKQRSYPSRAGLTSLGRWADNPALRAEATGFLARLSYRGVVDLDFRWDARRRRFLLLDANPRLGAQFRLFRDTAGIDVARAAYLDLTGQPVPFGDPVPGRGFFVENYAPVAALRHWRPSDETAWFAPDDLAPFGLMCLRMAWRAATRPLTGTGSPPAIPTPRYQSGRGANV